MKNNNFDNKLLPAKYINRFISQNSSADMMGMELFPNVKEILESYSFLYLVEEKLSKWDNNIQKSNPNIHCIVVGDGTKPRTAATMCFNTKWKVWSIDPELRIELQWEEHIRNLSCVDEKIQDVWVNQGEPEVVLIFLPHSHAPVQECWNNIYKDHPNKWLVKLECCTKDELPWEHFVFKDKYLMSSANKFKIWNNYLNLQYNGN